MLHHAVLYKLIDVSEVLTGSIFRATLIDAWHNIPDDSDIHTYCCANLKSYLVAIFSLFSKNESRLIKSPVCLSVGPLLITFEPLGRIS
jgi:hypothetical protein